MRALTPRCGFAATEATAPPEQGRNERHPLVVWSRRDLSCGRLRQKLVHGAPPGASDTWEAMKAAERAKRDTQIYLASVRGISHTVIGDSYGLSDRHISRIVEKQRKGAPSPLEGTAAE